MGVGVEWLSGRVVECLCLVVFRHMNNNTNNCNNKVNIFNVQCLSIYLSSIKYSKQQIVER